MRFPFRWPGPLRERSSLDRLLALSLSEMLDQPGCPLCRALAERERRQLTALLWEHVNDPFVAHRLERSIGFCWEHSWALVPAGRAVHSHLGVAILLARLLGAISQRSPYRASHGPSEPSGPCPICEWLASSEAALLDTAAALARQGELIGLRDRALLCFPHARRLAARDPTFPLAAWRQRVAVEEGTLTAEQRLALQVGRCPWFVPLLDDLPEYCPHCLTAASRGERCWIWWQTMNQGRVPRGEPVPCFGHVQHAPHDNAHRDRIVHDLNAFIAAADYRFRGELTAGERLSWMRAIAWLVGTAPAAGIHERSKSANMLG